MNALKQFCTALGPNAQLCETFVTDNFDDIIAAIDNSLGDSSVACYSLDACPWNATKSIKILNLNNWIW